MNHNAFKYLTPSAASFTKPFISSESLIFLQSETDDADADLLRTNGSITNGHSNPVSLNTFAMLSQSMFVFFLPVGIFRLDSLTSGYCLNLQYGSMETFEEEVPIKQAFAKNADKTILLLDSSKYNQIGHFQALTFEQIDVVISEQKPPEEYIRYFEEHKIEYVF